MSHEIDSMMYIGEQPWHGLGTRVHNPTTAEAVISAAGLDWEVSKHPVVVKHPGGETLVPNTFAMMRSDRMVGDDAPVLGIVGKQYTPIQNRVAFRWFDPIVSEGAATYETAGSLGQGERVWILAKLPNAIKVTDRDITEKYLLLYNSHDGSSAAKMMITPIRVVCQNTLTIALKGDSFIRIPHTRSATARTADIHDMIRFINASYDDIEGIFQRFAETEVDEQRLHEYIETVFPTKENDSQKTRETIEQHKKDAIDLFNVGRGNSEIGVSGTLWAAYNGITEFADHRMIAGTKCQSVRMGRLWFGDAAKLKTLAFSTAAHLSKKWSRV